MTIEEAADKAFDLLPRKVIGLYVKDEAALGMIYGVMAAEIFAQANGLAPIVFVQGEN